jgi:mannose-6-phosphate isomerase-like protein (cupin superfamily)
VIKGLKPEQYELCPQGLIGWYLQPNSSSDACLQDWWVFIHDIRGVSGRHRHQGGLVLFIIEGRGYSTMNGVRYDWEEGDMIIMPLLREGVEHQHFNLREDGSSKWLAFIHLPTWNEQGSELVQSALDPEFVERFGVTSWKGATTAVEKAVPQNESGARKGGSK